MSDRPKEKERVSSNMQSVEDDGANHRNSKKHKENHVNHTQEIDLGLEHPVGGESEAFVESKEPTEPSSPIRVRTGISYKDSLVGVLPGAYENAFFGNNMEEDGGVSSDEEGDGDSPEDGEVVIRFTRDLKQKIRAPWSTSLIVKVFGRSVGYIFLVNKLKFIWKAFGTFTCVDLGEGFFLIRFESRTSFEEVLKGGPWFIGEHFLSLRPWTPNFRASEASVSSVAVWVRLPELPVEYYHKEALLHIGSGLGPVLRVDVNTAMGTRGRFARICIQLDHEKPLARTIRVGKTKVAVIYEGIGLLCFQCGKIGHRKEWCPCNVHEETGNMPSTKQSPPSKEEDDKTKGFGPWMLVTRRKRQTQPAVQREPGAAPSELMAGAGVGPQDKTRSTNSFRYSALEKGKKAQSVGLRNKKSEAQTEPILREPVGEFSAHSDPITKGNAFSTGPIFQMSSFQSTKSLPSKHNSNLNTKPSSSKITLPPQAQTPNTTILSLRPQVPASKTGSLGHDNHKMGRFSNPQKSGELDDPLEGTECSDRRGRNRADSQGPAPCVGMVRRRDGSSLVRDSSGSPSKRCSRSPSPNRYGVAPRDKPFLEFSHGCAENKRDKLSTSDSLSAIAGAEISTISGRGVLCNTSGVRREKSSAVKSNPAHLERKSELFEADSACEVHTTIQDTDKLFRSERGGDPNLPVCNGSDSEQHMGDMAGEGMEFTRSGGHVIPDSKSTVYVVQ